jgi:hypothetical protein
MCMRVAMMLSVSDGARAEEWQAHNNDDPKQ